MKFHQTPLDVADTNYPDELEVQEHPFAKLAELNQIFYEWICVVNPTTFTVSLMFTCVSCGCMFWPMTDGDVLYPDRFSHAGMFADYCEATCECHDFPYEIQVHTIHEQLALLNQ